MGRLFGDELGFQREDGSSMLRDKFKKRCMEKAVKAREAKVQKARKWESSSEPDIDGDVGMSDEAPDDLEEEDEDEGINDEVRPWKATTLIHTMRIRSFCHLN